MLTRIWLENPKKMDRLGDYARWQDKNEICLEAVGWENKDWIRLAEDNDQIPGPETSRSIQGRRKVYWLSVYCDLKKILSQGVCLVPFS